MVASLPGCVPEDVEEMITLFQVNGVMSYVDPWGKPIGYEDVFTKIEMCRRHGVMIISDFAYGDDHTVPSAPPHPFTDGRPWIHLDIAGTAYTDREPPTQGKGPTGVLVRLFSEFLLARA